MKNHNESQNKGKVFMILLRGNIEIARLDLDIVKEEKIINLDSGEDVINKAKEGDHYVL